MPTVRTRFAPSPTGYMHIGGMRTALFNWLWARHCGGTFVLRIDDTDRQRNIEQALAPILQAFRWLDLSWDEGPEVGGAFGPYFQSQRDHLYREAAERLVAAGKAYRDYDAPEQIRADREAAEREKRSYLNVRRSLDLTPEQIAQYEAEGRPAVLRFLVPRDEKVVIDDIVRGRVEWDAGLMSDPVLLRADGTPLYNFATVVDDAQMQITHVVRAEEHLSNTPVQVLIHQALGNELPQFAHIPYVAAPGSKEKLSKRKLDKYRNNPQFKKMFEAADRVFPQIGLGGAGGLDPVMVEYYEKIGYLPEAVLNALARLGWSLDDKTEIMSRETVIENFTLDRVIKSPAGFDPDKLDSFQAYWMAQVPLEEKVERCLSYLRRAVVSGQWSVVSGEEAEVRGQRSEVRGQQEGERGASAPWLTLEAGVGQESVDRSQETVGREHHSPLTTHPQQTSSEVSSHITPQFRAYVARLIEALGDRLRLFSDILNYPEFFLPDEQIEYDEKAFEKRLREPGAAGRLRKFRDRLAAADPFEAPTLEKAMHDFIQDEQIKLAQIIHAVRVAVTGKPAGPGLFDCLSLLGRDRTLARIDRALAEL